MVWKSVLQKARCSALTHHVEGSFSLAECCCSQFALNGADGRGWRRGSIGVMVFRRLCAGLYRLYGLPRLFHGLSRGGGHSSTGL